MKTKRDAQKVAREWQTIFVDFYEWSDITTIVEDKDVIIKDTRNKGVFYHAGHITEFCAGRRLSWYISIDEEGYIYARIY